MRHNGIICLQSKQERGVQMSDQSYDEKNIDYRKKIDETHSFVENIIKLNPKEKQKLKYVLIGATLNSNNDLDLEEDTEKELEENKNNE